MRYRTDELGELAVRMRAESDDVVTKVLCPDEATAARTKAEIARRFGGEPWVSRVVVEVVPPVLRGSPYSLIEFPVWREET